MAAGKGGTRKTHATGTTPAKTSGAARTRRDRPVRTSAKTRAAEAAAVRARAEALEAERSWTPATGTSRWVEPAWAAGLGGVALVLYALTAARGTISGDTGELMTAASIWGVPHAPGYPLLTLTGGVFEHLVPIGSTTFRLSLVEALCSSAAVAVVYATTRRLTPQRAAAVVAALALATTPLYWRWSTAFEVFALADLIVVVLVHLLIRWHQQPERSGFLYGAAFVFGLGLTDQQSVVFLVPAVGWLLVRNRARLLAAPRRIGWAALAVLAGLLPYVYVPIAAAQNPALSWDDVHSVADFGRLVTRSDYGSALTLASGTNSGGSPFVRIAQLGASLGLVLGLLALAGLVQAWRVRRWYFWFAVLGFVFTGPVFQLFANLDARVPSALFVLQRFFLLPMVVVAPVAGLGVVALGSLLDAVPSVARAGRGVVVVAAVAALAVAGLAVQTYGRVDASDDRVSSDYAHDILAPLPRHAILLVSGDAALAPVYFAHDAEHLRPDVTVVNAGSITAGWYRRQLRRAGLVVPAQRTALALVDANRDRPIALVGDFPDTSTNGRYFVYRDGLSFDVLPVSENRTAQQLAADNGARLPHLHVPDWRHVRHRSFEPQVLDEYATIPYEVGEAFLTGKDVADARPWLERALRISPHNPKIRNAVEQLP